MTMTNIINFNKVRDTKDADAYRLAQAQKMLDLFEAANGRPASTTKELGQWLNSPQGVAATANHRNENGTINPCTITKEDK
jgi:hypothetical protein